MFRFDRKRFFVNYRAKVANPLTQGEVDNLNQILDRAEKDKRIDCIRQLAYMIVTARWETRRFERLREVGSKRYLSQYDGKGGNRLGTNDYYEYRGGGWCHTTFRDNYAKATRWCRAAGMTVDLVLQPSRIEEPDINYEVMVTGHLTGGFTGFALGKYVNDTNADYRNARLVINPGELYIADGKWKATEKRKAQCIEAVDQITTWARACESALRASELDLSAPPAEAPVGSAPTETFQQKSPEEDTVGIQLSETAKAQAGDIAKASLTGFSVTSILSWIADNRWVTTVIVVLLLIVLGIIFRNTLKALLKKLKRIITTGL